MLSFERSSESCELSFDSWDDRSFRTRGGGWVLTEACTLAEAFTPAFSLAPAETGRVCVPSLERSEDARLRMEEAW